MNTYKQFLIQVNALYKDIEKQFELVKTRGLEPNKAFSKGKCGYLIAFLHDPKIGRKISEISENISNIVPAIMFEESVIHTTISTNIDRVKKPKKDELQILTSTVKSTIKECNELPRIDFNKLLINQDSVILIGQPNEAFFSISQNIVKNVNSKGLHYRMPKMAHITISRFLSRSNPKTIDKLIKFVKNIELSEDSVLRRIGVGFYWIDKKGMVFKREEIEV